MRYDCSVHDIHSAKVENAHKEFQKAIGAALVWFVPERGALAVISRCDTSQRRAQMLQEMHFRYTHTHTRTVSTIAQARTAGPLAARATDVRIRIRKPQGRQPAGRPRR